MEQIVLLVHVIIALAITGLILLQQGKGADMGASLGGGASQTLFGSQGSGNLLTRLTTLLAVLFFVSSLTLAVFAKQKALAVDTGSIPAVVESKVEDTTTAEALKSEINAQMIEANMKQQAGEDIPAVNIVDDANMEEGFDIPATESAPSSTGGGNGEEIPSM